MKQLSNLFRAACLAVVVQFAGCATLGLPTAETFNQKLAVGYGTVTAVRNTATALFLSEKITIEDAENVQQHADTARAGLDVASSVQLIDPTTAEKRLSASLTMLRSLQDFLMSKGAK